jgi:hypothetical protein
MRNDAKRSEKDAKTNSKQARGSETKQNKVSLLYFRLHEPYKTILTHAKRLAKNASFACFASKRNIRNWHFSQHVSHGLEWFYMVQVSETKAISLCFA